MKLRDLGAIVLASAIGGFSGNLFASRVMSNLRESSPEQKSVVQKVSESLAQTPKPKKIVEHYGDGITTSCYFGVFQGNRMFVERSYLDDGNCLRDIRVYGKEEVVSGSDYCDGVFDRLRISSIMPDGSLGKKRSIFYNSFTGTEDRYNGITETQITEARRLLESAIAEVDNDAHKTIEDHCY